jgi:ribosomal protein L16/L10AE
MKKKYLVTFKKVRRLKKRNIGLGSINLEPNIRIFAKKNYRITEEQIKAIKTDLITPKGLTEGKLIKDFIINIIISPNKVLTKKGILVRMGKGKGKINTYARYLTEGTICVEIKFKSNKLSKNIIKKILNKLIKKYTFLSYKIENENQF